MGILTIVLIGKPVEINKEIILSKIYPYQQNMYLYTMGEPKGNLEKLIHFMKSDTGTAIIESAGFFPIQ